MKSKLITTVITATCIAASALCQLNAQTAVPGASPAAVSGEKHQHHQFDPERKLTRLTKRLDLTQAQQGQILPLLQQEAGTINSVKENASLSKKQKKQQIRASFKSIHGQILALLTPGQQAKLRQMHHGHRKQDGNAATPGASAGSTPAVQ